MLARISGMAAVIFMAAVAYGTPVQWPVSDGGNGHWYDYIPGNETWTSARVDAASRTFDGLPGHLVTITSAAENDFIFQHFSPVQAWIGGYQATTPLTTPSRPADGGGSPASPGLTRAGPHNMASQTISAGIRTTPSLPPGRYGTTSRTTRAPAKLASTGSLWNTNPCPNPRTGCCCASAAWPS